MRQTLGHLLGRPMMMMTTTTARTMVFGGDEAGVGHKGISTTIVVRFIVLLRESSKWLGTDSTVQRICLL